MLRSSMRTYMQRIAVTLCVTLSILLPVNVARGDEAATPDAAEDAVIFIPPPSGAPADRMGAGTRQLDGMRTSATLLAPPQGGISARAQPLLVWHLDAPLDGPLTIMITPIGGLGRGFTATLPGRFAAGFHALDLSRSRAALAPAQLYQWQVARNGAPIAEPAFVEHRPVDTAPETARAAAAAGLWYDAVAAVFAVDFSGRVKLTNPDGLSSLSASAGLDLTKILDAQQ